MKVARSLALFGTLARRSGVATLTVATMCSANPAQAKTSLPWPPGSTTVIYGHSLPTAKADRCTRKACFNVFVPYHNQTYAHFGRISGYYAARRFVPASGQPVVLYYVTSVYPSSSAAAAAWTDEDHTMTDYNVDCFTKACPVVVDRRRQAKRLIDYVVKGDVVIELMAETSKANLANRQIAAGLVATLKSLEPIGSGQPKADYAMKTPVRSQPAMPNGRVLTLAHN